MLTVISRAFVREGGRRVRVKGDLEMLATLLALKMKKGVMSQGMQVTSRIWKEQRKELSPRVSRRNAAPRKPKM